MILSAGIGIGATVGTGAAFWPDPPKPAAVSCPDEETIKTLRELAFLALDEAFRSHIERLYEVWMKDDTPDQAQRVARGIERAVRVYVHGQVGVRKWQPLCR